MKNVVLPAPLGPISETIALRGTVKSTSLTATRPPKTFETPRRLEDAAAVGGRGVAHGALAPRSATSVDLVLVELELSPAVGMKPSGRSTIITSRKKPKMPKEIDVTSKSSPMSGAVELRQPEAVDHRQRDGAEDDAPDVAHAAEDDHARMKTEKPNSNWSTLTVFL